MADVFISYARTDRLLAAHIAEAVEREGWTVWWDRDIVAGESFAQLIEKQLVAAKCVIVLWTVDSVVSPWVLNEASEALGRGILVPLVVRGAQPPLAFRHLHFVEMPTTEPADLYNAVKECMTAIAKVLGATLPIGDSPPDPLSAIRQRFLAAHSWQARAASGRAPGVQSNASAQRRRDRSRAPDSSRARALTIYRLPCTAGAFVSLLNGVSHSQAAGAHRNHVCRMEALRILHEVAASAV